MPTMFAIVVVAWTAAGVRAETEDHESLGGEDGVHVLSAAVFFAAVLLDKLTLLELDGVAGEVDFLLLVSSVEPTEDLGAAHELGVHVGLGGVLADLGGEGVLLGGAGAEGGGEEGKRELHDELLVGGRERRGVIVRLLVVNCD